jgi:DNA-binding MarR family transcriptional regulator
MSPIYLGDLAAEFAMLPASLSPLVKRLEAQGRVSRTRNADDERVLDISLTDEGLALREDAVGVPHQIMERVGMDAAEIAALRAALVRFAGRATDSVPR